MIEKVLHWIMENREWFFSGIGVTVLLSIVTFFRKTFCKDSQSKKHVNIEQNNKGQNNTQIGIQNNYFGGNKNER